MNSDAALLALLRRARVVGDCLVWTRGTNSGGYGRIRFEGEVWLVHRLAWIARHGPIPPEAPFVLHRCDNPPCFADEHLRVGTHADNMADLAAKLARRRHAHPVQKPVR